MVWVTMMGIPKGGSPVRGQGVNDIDPEGREAASVGWELMTSQAQASRRIRAGNALYLYTNSVDGR